VTHSLPNAQSDLQLVTSSNFSQKIRAKNYEFSTRGKETGGGVSIIHVFLSVLKRIYQFGVPVLYHLSLDTRMPSQNGIFVRKLMYYSNGHEIPSFQSSQIPITVLQKATIKQHPSPAAPSRRLYLCIRRVSIPYTSNLTAFLYPL
jgi:hypothetical protein